MFQGGFIKLTARHCRVSEIRACLLLSIILTPASAVLKISLANQQCIDVAQFLHRGK
jgi:hypothetical protein